MTGSHRSIVLLVLTMPAKDPHYHAKWNAKRRAEFFNDKHCVDCRSTERLELDHIDPTTKTDHKIWSWRKSRRDEEIRKCEVRCRRCHPRRTAAQNKARWLRTGQPNLAQRKLDRQTVQQILAFIAAGVSERRVALILGIGRHFVNGIQRRQCYNNWLVAFPGE
jgi:hypothetical protein